LSTHLNDADLQQLINSKTNRKIDFRYEATVVDSKSIGLIHIPIQDRPSYLKKDFGKLKANAVYIRRGSSTDTALPDEIAKMGGTSAVSHPRLRLRARVARSGYFLIVISIENELDAGPARAPRLSISIPGPFSEANYGVDGNGNFGLPRLPQGIDTGFKTYGGDASTVIPAGETHDVTGVEYNGQHGGMPKSVTFTYKLSAEGFEPITSTLTLDL
jgi:hypothetical protein